MTGKKVSKRGRSKGDCPGQVSLAGHLRCDVWAEICRIIRMVEGKEHLGQGMGKGPGAGKSWWMAERLKHRKRYTAKEMGSFTTIETGPFPRGMFLNQCPASTPDGGFVFMGTFATCCWLHGWSSPWVGEGGGRISNQLAAKSTGVQTHTYPHAPLFKSSPGPATSRSGWALSESPVGAFFVTRRASTGRLTHTCLFF